MPETTAPAAPRRVLVTGSRDWTDTGVISVALVEHMWPGDVLVHGAARGADSLAAGLWEAFGPVEPHPYPAGHGQRGGYVRNKEMVDAGADLCLAFIRNNSRGASMCAELAAKAGIPVVIYREGAEQ